MTKIRTVAIDESLRGSVFVLLGLVATESQEKTLGRRLNALRLEIKQQLLIDAPRLASHPKLTGDLLPELHAEPLLQSGSYYRLAADDPGFKPNYWHRQFEWFEQAIKLIVQTSPSVAFLSKRADNGELGREADELIADLKPILTKYAPRKSEKVLRKVKNLAMSPYFRYFPEFIAGLDQAAKLQNLSFRVIADNREQEKGFSDDAIYTVLRSNGLTGHLTTPAFLSSDDEILLQAADLLAYSLCVHIDTQISGATSPRAMVCHKAVHRWKRQRGYDIEKLAHSHTHKHTALHIHLLLSALEELPGMQGFTRIASLVAGHHVTRLMMMDPRHLAFLDPEDFGPNALGPHLNLWVRKQSRRGSWPPK